VRAIPGFIEPDLPVEIVAGKIREDKNAPAKGRPSRLVRHESRGKGAVLPFVIQESGPNYFKVFDAIDPFQVFVRVLDSRH
jgi:hypothetical protein